MSFVSSQERTNRANLSLLRGNTFFREISNPRAKRIASKLDGVNLKRKAIILARRKLNPRLRLAFVLSLIYLIFALAFAILV
ncbi:MAG: hypothetical protein JJ895_01465 [Balneolaceae bacterium]|nr:hypothetical protein [Balneolaceae bacterium]